MTIRYLFLLGASPDDPIRWAKCDDDHVAEAGRLDDAYALQVLRDRIGASDRIIVILPGEQVALRLMPAPPKSTAKFNAAARYLLEDELAETADHLHISVFLKNDQGAALAVKRNIVEQWTAIFHDNGVNIDKMTADYLSLPQTDEKPCILIDGERTIAAFGDRGFAAENMLGELCLSQLIDDLSSGAVDKFVLSSNADGAARAAVSHPVEIGPEDVFALYLRGLTAAPSIDILKGKGRLRRQWRQNLGAWRRPAMLAASLLVVSFATFIAGGVRDLQAAKLINEEAHALHEQYFPEATGADLRAHARATISSNNGVGFLDLSEIFADALSDTPAVSVDRLRYDEARARLVVSVRSSDDQTIETLRKALTDRGALAEDAGGYRRSGDQWSGDMIVRLP